MTKPIDTSFTGRLDPTQIGALFTAMVTEIARHMAETDAPAYHVVELGVGPGYLALALLEQLPNITYEGVDFSAPMIEMGHNCKPNHMPLYQRGRSMTWDIPT